MSISLLILKLVLVPAVLLLLTLLANITQGVVSRLAKHAMLRGVRGPRSKSFLAGNLQDLYDIGGLPHLKALADYGGVAKVHGLFGVCLSREREPQSVG